MSTVIVNLKYLITYNYMFSCQLLPKLMHRRLLAKKLLFLLFT